ncbi:MAG: hypothetical protein OXN83_00125, partial [Oligoflexia bacterium]|nr:hypothetical protein [Oligoflexia bacterium]
IHKSKGLEFDHVILLDFSMDKSALQTGRKMEEITVFDRKRYKMAVAVPIGGREKPKVRSYGHELYNQTQNQMNISEAERLYYVAMTRAKESLAVFFPHGNLPKKNSWLKEVDYFSKIRGLLQKEDVSKVWRLNSGVYQQDSYSLTVLDCENVNQNAQSFIKFSKDLKSKTVVESQIVSQDMKKVSDSSDLNLQVETVSFSQIKNHLKSEEKLITPNQPVISAKAEISLQPKALNGNTESNVVSVSDIPLKAGVKINDYSSKDFIQFITQIKNQKRSDFSLMKTKNILFKSSVGNQLHFFLQKLFYFPFEKLNHLIHTSPSLSKENQEKIKKALLYIKKLKEPDMSSCFKTGFSEWPFKFQKRNIILKGQIDLWSWFEKEIYLFDYKSAVSNNVKNQLIFYSWILDQMYQPEAIWMYESYPLEGKTRKTLYQPQHKELFETWFKTL